MIAQQEQTVLFDANLADAWVPSERVAPDDWARENVTLPPDAPIKGRLDHRNAPYLPGLMRLATARGVSQLNVKKAGQIGLSAMTRWLLGFWSVFDPSPTGLTLPDRTKGRKIVRGSVIPFYRDTDALRALMTKDSADESSEQIRLMNGFTLSLMWAGSATSTASDPLKRVINDETDKMQAWGRGGGEGHAVYRTLTRMRVFQEEALQINVSTPTTTTGMIHRLFEASHVHLYFLIACPKCGTRIRLVFGRVKWKHNDEKLPDQEWSMQILRDRAAWYECQACGETFDDRERRHACQDGKWGTCDDRGIADGEIVDATTIEEWSSGTKIGVQISAIYCMWESFAKIASMFILARNDIELLFTFITETLGDTFEQQLERTRPTKFSELSETAEYEEGIVPAWCAALIATIDTQKDHFWIVIRAWGPNMRSQRVFHGRIETFADLDRLCFQTPWHVVDETFPPMTCDLVLIDSGGTKLKDEELSRTMDVYAWAYGYMETPFHSGEIRAIKGAPKPKPGQFYWRGRGWYDDGSKSKDEKIEVPLWHLNVHHYQNQLAGLIMKTIETGAFDDEDRPVREPLWQLNQRNDNEYNTHMGNLQKTGERKGTEVVEVWRPVQSGARVDLRHCEGYQVAGAYMRQIHVLPSLDEFLEMKQAALVPATAPSVPVGITQPDGRPWIPEQG